MRNSVSIEQGYRLMFGEYPDVVDVETMRTMLSGIGRRMAYRLLRDGTIESVRIQKSIALGIPVKGNKRKALEMLEELKLQYNEGTQIAFPRKPCFFGAGMKPRIFLFIQPHLNTNAAFSHRSGSFRLGWASSFSRFIKSRAAFFIKAFLQSIMARNSSRHFC